MSIGLYQIRCLVGTTSNLLLVFVGWKNFVYLAPDFLWVLLPLDRGFCFLAHFERGAGGSAGLFRYV